MSTIKIGGEGVYNDSGKPASLHIGLVQHTPGGQGDAIPRPEVKAFLDAVKALDA